MGSLILPSCIGMSSLGSVPSTSVGSVAQVITGTVVSARDVTLSADSADKNLGTGLGAAVGAGAGALLGGGRANLVSSVGFGVLGAVTGRALGAATGRVAGQELVIKADGSKSQYRVIQPVYKQVGAIPVGTHGTLEIGSNGKFLPDGM